MPDAADLLGPILALHRRIRDTVLAASAAAAAGDLAAVASDEPGDTIYVVDRVSERVLVEGLAEIARDAPVCLVAEGLPGGSLVLPRGAPEGRCRWRVIVDPIDGTRGLMYQKRSAWILTGVAPDRGPATRLRDIELAVQTEIPLVKQHLSDQFWAVRGGGVTARRFDRVTGNDTQLALRPSGEASLHHAFATVVRFFPGARDVLAAIDDDLMRALLGPFADGKAPCFEDQYLSTGGQLYELLAGHDRFIADLRPLVHPLLAARGLPRGLCCHPYDLCTMLIAQQGGVVLEAPDGSALDAPLDLHTDVAWVGYANRGLRDAVAPALRAALGRHGLHFPHAPPGAPARDA